MKRVLWCLACLVPLSSARAEFLSNITMTECFSSAPNVFGSPSWASYVTNAITGIENGCVATGDPNSPSYYQSGSSFLPGDLIVTDYNSWQGQTGLPAPFDGEYGNRLHAGLLVNGNGTQFSLSELQFSMTSSDPADALQFSGDFDATDSYSSTRVGIIHGPDGDTYVTSGPATQLVDELVYVGVGNAFCSGTGGCGGGPFESISDLTAYMASNAPFSVTNTYSLVDSSDVVLASVTATADVAVPEPSTLLSLAAGVGLLGLCGVRRRLGRRS